MLEYAAWGILQDTAYIVMYTVHSIQVTLYRIPQQKRRGQKPAASVVMLAKGRHLCIGFEIGK